MNETYYTAEQIADLLHMHVKTVQRYIREGKLRAVKIGKSWRVSGHDLSVFTESDDVPERHELPAQHATASGVVDIDVTTRDEAIRIVNALTAGMNGKPPEYGPSSMQAQFIEPESKVRISLWGSVKFMAAIFSAIEALTEPKQEEPL